MFSTCPEMHTVKENGRFDKIPSNQVNVHGFEDFGEFQSELTVFYEL